MFNNQLTGSGTADVVITNNGSVPLKLSSSYYVCAGSFYPGTFTSQALITIGGTTVLNDTSQLPSTNTLSCNGSFLGQAYIMQPNTTVTLHFAVSIDATSVPSVADLSGAFGFRSDPVSCAPVTSIVATTNENCNPAINAACTPNIVLANGLESTGVSITVQPAQAVNLNLSTTFGDISQNTYTDSTGRAIATYVSGKIMSEGDTNTTIGTLSANPCGQTFPNLETIFNYRGFDFHNSVVTDAEFTNAAAMDSNSIQAFFKAQRSFLAQFVFVEQMGGFIDKNGNGHLDRGEPTYSAPGMSIPLQASGTSAAEVFFNTAMVQGINPKVLIATAEKENALISKTTLPSPAILNFAMGCGSPSAFRRQIECAARTLVNRFNETSVFTPPRVVTYPFFFHAADGIQHAVTGLGRQPVGFQVTFPSAYAQYRYTPFIQALPTGGGVYLFETTWKRFGF